MHIKTDDNSRLELVKMKNLTGTEPLCTFVLTTPDYEQLINVRFMFLSAALPVALLTFWKLLVLLC